MRPAGNEEPLTKTRKKGVGLRFWIPTSQDVYDLAKRVEASGIKLDEGPAKLEWEADAFTLTDPDGFKITIFNDPNIRAG